MSSYSIFKVIKIIDEYSIVINGGLNHSVSVGDKIEIFVIGDDITDPFHDNKSLGTLDFIKETLTVTEIYREFSVCKKIIENEEYQPTTIEKALQPFGGRGITITKEVAKKIQIDPQEATGRKTAKKTIRIGDDARIAISS